MCRAARRLDRSRRNFRALGSGGPRGTTQYISRLVMLVLETRRLALRHATFDDDDFILRLLNEPSFLRFIGDRGVRTHDDARRYIGERLIGSYERNGFGLWVVVRKETPSPIGICGLVKRD